MNEALGLRPLTARSVVASLLLGTAGGTLPVGLLVETATLFGIEEGTTRTALSRMVDRGEATVAGGAYTLAGRLAQRAARQAVGRRPPRTAWRGEWHTVLVAADRRPASERAALRNTMAAARFGALRDGVWMRPNTLPPPLPAGCHVLTGRLDADDDPVALARQLWDLEAWSAHAGRLRRAMAPTVRALDGGDVDALAPGFMVAAAVLRHINADPLLPAALLPARWPGADLRAEYDRYERAFQAVLRTWYRKRR